MKNKISEILHIDQESQLKKRFSQVEFLCDDTRLLYNSAMSKNKTTLHDLIEKVSPPNMIHMFALLIFYITRKVTYLFDLFLGYI